MQNNYSFFCTWYLRLIGVLSFWTQHVLIRHGPWFIEKYGSLSIWSCQGMEKSHHAAKAATQAHTQHGGTGNRTSVIVQQYQWWYRCIQHRHARKEQLKHDKAVQGMPDVEKLHAAAQRREAWHESSAAAAHEAWQNKRQREGKHWVPLNEVNV